MHNPYSKGFKECLNLIEYLRKNHDLYSLRILMVYFQKGILQGILKLIFKR